jgi:hypothetical protein
MGTGAAAAGERRLRHDERMRRLEQLVGTH